jgi:hydroxypyruvate isomerase
MEYLNSKVNHKDYVRSITWGIDVMSRVNSPRVKILFDIYHAQIMMATSSAIFAITLNGSAISIPAKPRPA